MLQKLAIEQDQEMNALDVGSCMRRKELYRIAITRPQSNIQQSLFPSLEVILQIILFLPVPLDLSNVSCLMTLGFCCKYENTE